MKKTLCAAALAASLSAAGTAAGADFDFSGSFANDNDVLRFNFTLGAPGVVTLFTSSWLGGGFDPIVSVWDSSGNQLAEQDDGFPGGSQVSNGTVFDYGEFDSYLAVNLAAGDYLATLAQYDNFSVSTTLADGFLRDADPNFTAAFGCSNGRFCEGSLLDSNNNPVEPNRTAAWEFHIVNVDAAQAATVPEPPTLMLLGLSGLFMLGGRYAKPKNGRRYLCGEPSAGSEKISVALHPQSAPARIA
ncbi:DVUA0089 family protein [Methylomonas koyamae]|uniref:DVUA0089 family protein n=1 Tax=Methylomonas koyamae TaxID=702114 RepID=UPI002872E2CF|nr:DVUA0089 family protein [Methylomonas koyamae]WNB74464.1 DVUA0089 family protein [Methylomonas koyamae]